MRPFLITAFFLLVSLVGQSQRFHRMQGTWMFRTESSVGVVPRIQFNQGYNLGLGIGLGQFALGEYGGSGTVLQLGGQYDIQRQAAGMHLDAWLNGIALVLPYGLGLSANRYWTDAGGVNALRFELGVGGVKGMFTYGWNGYSGAGKEAWNGPRHTLQLRIYLAVWPSRRSCVSPVGPARPF